jgi:hypothetical protein
MKIASVEPGTWPKVIHHNEHFAFFDVNLKSRYSRFHRVSRWFPVNTFTETPGVYEQMKMDARTKKALRMYLLKEAK